MNYFYHHNGPFKIGFQLDIQSIDNLLSTSSPKKKKFKNQKSVANLPQIQKLPKWSQCFTFRDKFYSPRLKLEMHFNDDGHSVKTVTMFQASLLFNCKKGVGSVFHEFQNLPMGFRVGTVYITLS
jgi:hypothetical protein